MALKEGISLFWKKWRILIIAGVLAILFFVTLPPAQAVELKAAGVPSYSFDAPAGNVIYQILVDELPMGINQSHTLTVGSATYLLTIQSSNPYDIYYDFDIGWTYPNGTTTTVHKSITRLPGAKYKTNIQPVYTQAESGYSVLWDIDLEIGTKNTSVSTGINAAPEGWSATDAIPFTSAAGSFGSSTNVYLYTMSSRDFQDHVVHYDPVFGLQNLGSTVFQWTWDSALGFIYQIPVIGPLFVSIITVLGAVISEISTWVIWILLNLKFIIPALEGTILMFSLIMAGKKPKFGKVLGNIFNYNVAVGKGFLWLINLIWGWTRGFIDLVTKIVGALKPF